MLKEVVVKDSVGAKRRGEQKKFGFVDGVLSWKKHCELNECTK